jgi:hypothetical protein
MPTAIAQTRKRYASSTLLCFYPFSVAMLKHSFLYTKKTAKVKRQGKENTSLQEMRVYYTYILTNLTTFNCKPDYKTFGMLF